jgi:hypothetical protein
MRSRLMEGFMGGSVSTMRLSDGSTPSFLLQAGGSRRERGVFDTKHTRVHSRAHACAQAQTRAHISTLTPARRDPRQIQAQAQQATPSRDRTLRSDSTNKCTTDTAGTAGQEGHAAGKHAHRSRGHPRTPAPQRARTRPLAQVHTHRHVTRTLPHDTSTVRSRQPARVFGRTPPRARAP